MDLPGIEPGVTPTPKGYVTVTPQAHVEISFELLVFLLLD